MSCCGGEQAPTGNLQTSAGGAPARSLPYKFLFKCAPLEFPPLPCPALAPRFRLPLLPTFARIVSCICFFS